MRLTPTGYVIEIEDILTDMKMRHSQAIAREKFGLVASRIIRILHESKRLEEKSIAEIAVAPAKKTRELLHKMLNEGFVGLQEIAKSSDRNPARTFYLWNTPTTRLFERLLDSFYFTASNLQARIRSENDSARSVVDKVRLDYSLSALETKTFNAWRTSATRLNHARGEILDLIFLFRDDDAL